MVDPFSIKECMFVCESSSGEEGHCLVVFVYVIFILFDILYLEVNKEFTVSCLCPGHVFTLLYKILDSDQSVIQQLNIYKQ